MATNNKELVGKELGTCILQQLIGQGGMGAVYLARQSRPRRTVAIKVLRSGTFLESQHRTDFLTRFRREADAVAVLDHINIMPVYEYGEQEDIAYLVMPYVTGGTLRQILETRGQLSIEEAIPIFEQAASALDCAHAQGIIHRDLKPANILFHADGRALLADFGLAKMIKEARDSDSKGHTALTSAGTIIGTPEYLSPEQGTGKAVDYRTDVYSLGVVAFEMLGGRVPFTGATPVAIAIKHALEEPPLLSQINPAISLEVAEVVKKALAKNPDHRYTSAGEFAQTLRMAAGMAPRQSSDFLVYNATSTSVKTPRFDQNATEPDVPKARMHNAQTEADAPPAASPAFHLLKKATPRSPVPRTPELPQQVGKGPWQEAEFTTKKQAVMNKQGVQAAPRFAEPERVLQPIVRNEVVQREETNQPLAVRSFQQQASTQQPDSTRAGTSFKKLLLATLVVLLVIVGGLSTYLHFAQGSGIPSDKGAKAAANTINPAIQTLLPPAAISAGRRIYGTNLPGAQCDKQGGEWGNTSSTAVTCDMQATTLTNTGNKPLAGIYLSHLPSGQQLPEQGYIIQVQAIVNENTTGDVGVFFLTQTGQQFTTYTFMLNPTSANSWSGGYYNDATGNDQSYFTTSLEQKVSGTVTLDVLVRGNTASLYLNGQQLQGSVQGGVASGTFGLAVGKAGRATFKNIEIFALA